MTAIRLAGITKRFGSTVAVDAVTLQIESGEVFFLLGPSGCGKTTLLRILAGFTAPDAGEVYFDNQCVTALPPQRRDCAMVFQNYALWPHLSVADNVAFGLEVRRLSAAERRRRVREALAMVHLEGLADRKPGELSGGQQQRVALARALVVRPRCLLLDEPLSNLDAKLRVEMRAEIRQLCKQAELTTVYVTHDQKEALSMADRVALMREGAVVQCDPPERLYRRPATRFAADFVGETNFLPAQVAGARGGRITLQTALGRFDKAAGDEQTNASRAAAGTGAGNPTGESRDSEGGTRSAPEAVLIGQQTLVVVGAAVTCALRPEALHIAEIEPPLQRDRADTVRFAATVRETTYLGEAAQHVLEVNGSELRLRALEPNPTGPPPAGNVHAWFSTEDLILLAD